MANYNTLKTAIADVVKTNGNNEITGALLQQVLFAIINSLGADYQFVGVANTSTAPGTPDQRVFYIAGPGTYPNFNNAEIRDGYIGIFSYADSWSLQTFKILNSLFGNTDFSNNGYLNATDGEFVANNSYITTDFIPISGGDTIKVYNSGLASLDVAYYDADKHFISGIPGTDTAVKNYVAPDGAYYFRSSNYKANCAAPYVQLLVNVYERVVQALNNPAKIEQDQITADKISSIYGTQEYPLTTILQNGYFVQNGVIITQESYNGISAVSATGMTVGKRYLVKIGSYVAPSLYKNFFIFVKTQNEAAIDETQISNYVELLDAENFIYVITIPENCTAFYTAGYNNVISTFFVKEFGTKGLFWLTLNKENINDEFLSAVTRKISKTFDSIKKPIEFNGKRLLAFGDSITYGICSPNLDYAGDNKFISLFCSYVGALLTNYAQSGATLTTGNQDAQSICTKILQTSDPADIIFVAGGVNDWALGASVGNFTDSVTTTVYGAMNAICSYLKTNYPNAVVIFVTPIPTTSTDFFGGTHPDTLNLYRVAIQEVAAKNGFNVVDGSKLGLPDEMTDYGNYMFAPSDRVHPTLAGHALYARSLTGKLL